MERKKKEVGDSKQFEPLSFFLQTDQSVSTAETGDLIEFVNPLLGLSLWGVYVGEGYVIHFGVGGKKLKLKKKDNAFA